MKKSKNKDKKILSNLPQKKSKNGIMLTGSSKEKELKIEKLYR